MVSRNRKSNFEHICVIAVCFNFPYEADNSPHGLTWKAAPEKMA